MTDVPGYLRASGWCVEVMTMNPILDLDTVPADHQARIDAAERRRQVRSALRREGSTGPATTQRLRWRRPRSVRVAPATPAAARG